MNQEAKHLNFVEQVSNVFEMKHQTQNGNEILPLNHASYPLLVGNTHFSLDLKNLGEIMFRSGNFLRYLRFVMILRIILRRKVTKRSDANLGREEKTVLELDQSSLEGSFDQEFNTEKSSEK